ncbi:MAG TPA: isochorismatase family cysteine hydrolase [Micromonosporaceae bacterium]
MPKVPVEIDVPTPRAELGVDADRTVVLVVDMQNESCHPDGKNYDNPEAASAVTATAELIERARTAGCRVIWLQSVRRRDQPIFSVFGVERYRIEGTWNVELAAPLKPLGDEPLFVKYSHDCFYNTDLDRYLAEQGVLGPDWTFVVTGVSFAGCVYIAVTGLSVRDYRVVVPMDCVSPQTGTRAQVTMSRLGHRSYSYNVTLVGSGAGLQFT